MIGIQLYTVREAMTDFESSVAVIRKLSDMGYDFVQLAGKIESVEMTAAACKECGMPVIGILTGRATCEEQKERLFCAARLCGAKDIGISSLATNSDEVEDLLFWANSFKKVAEDNGFSFSYHNHSNELMRCEDGRTVMDRICEDFEGYLMPDTYWLQHGGVDVRDFIDKNGEKIKILHLKDMKRTADGPTFAELGMGNLNFKGIVKTAVAHGVELFVVEQDKCDIDPLESARISVDYFNSLQ